MANNISKVRLLKAKRLIDDVHPENVSEATAMKDILFELSMFCKEKGWHRSGLLACVASDELEQMLKQGLKTQEPYENEK